MQLNIVNNNEIESKKSFCESIIKTAESLGWKLEMVSEKGGSHCSWNNENSGKCFGHITKESQTYEDILFDACKNFSLTLNIK